MLEGGGNDDKKAKKRRPKEIREGGDRKLLAVLKGPGRKTNSCNSRVR